MWCSSSGAALALAAAVEDAVPRWRKPAVWLPMPLGAWGLAPLLDDAALLLARSSLWLNLRTCDVSRQRWLCLILTG